MEKKIKREEEQEGQLFVWQGYTGKVELISFKTFLTRPVRRVSLGADHSLILTFDDSLFACGSNEFGQLGCPDQNIPEYSFDPCLVTALSGKGITYITCGTNHSASVTKDGCLYLWGDNQHGQCGRNPQETSIHSPSLVELSFPETVCAHGVPSPGAKDSVHKISCGASHSLAVSVEGNVWVWGSGPQLGLGSDSGTWKPKLLEKFQEKKVLDICCGDFHSTVLVKEDSNEPSSTNKSKSKEGADELRSPSKVENVTHEPKILSKVSSGDCEKCQGEIRGNVHSQTVSKFGTRSKEDVIDEKVKVKPGELKLDTEHLEESGDSSRKSDKADQTKPPVANKDNASESKARSIGEEKSNVTDNGEVVMVEKSEVTSLESKQTGDQVDKEGDENGTEKLEVDLRPKSIPSETLEDILTASIRSDSSVVSNRSSKTSLSTKNFLDETGAREFLARQFQDEDALEAESKPNEEPMKKVVTKPAPTSGSLPSPTAYMMQTMTSLTSTVTTMTSKTLSSTFNNITSLTDKLGLTTAGTEVKSSPDSLDVTVRPKSINNKQEAEVEANTSSETLNVSTISELETDSAENINLDKSLLEFSNLTVSDTSLNTSQMSLADSERSAESGGSVESSPMKTRGNQSVGKAPQSIRFIEAKQENLRKRSLSLLTAEGKEEKDTCVVSYSLDTEVWVWGKNNKGQLGLGDMLDREEPVCLQTLTGHRIVKLACGSYHTLALSSSGEVYSWGQHDSGQLGHGEYACCPGKVELTSDCCVWSLDAGSNHSVFLIDSAGTQGTKPEVFYTGKHPSKELYVPIYKTHRLTQLKFLKKAGWICSVTTGGDNCACLSHQDSDYTHVVFELARFMRELHKHLQQITQEFVKRIQISGFFTGLEVQPHKDILDHLLSSFTDLTNKFGVASVEVTDRLVQGESIIQAQLFTRYDDYLTELKDFSSVFEDMVATGGFEFCVKSGSSLFDNLQECYPDLLKMSQTNVKPDHANMFRQLMNTPLAAIKDLSAIVYKFSELYDKASKENNLASSVHLNLEHFLRTSQSAISDADNTRMFWESSTPKLSESLKDPTRRLIKESRSSPLSLHNAGRFSTHTFYLFNDVFIHAQSSGHQSYLLETVWIDAPAADTPNSPQNVITVTTPDDVLTLTTTTPQIKVEWVMAFNTAINKVLASQKSVSRQNSGDRVHTPVVRLAKHTFTKHNLYREANYRGYWLNGKVHGSGIIKWPDGRKYKGKFKHGTITGAGKMSIPKENDTEEIQEGTWKDSKLHGHGRIRYSTGDLYEGYFKEGLRHGHGVFRKGRYLSSASFVYVGEWLFDKKHGYGVMDDILKGEKYMGMWQEDKRHGDGVVVTLDGMYFEGNFQYDKLVGNGLMLTDDNSCYEGEFSGITMLQGKGCLTFPSGDKIEGTFSGTWNQGLKINGTFHKTALTASVAMKQSWNRCSPDSVSSLFGKLCVKPERKWEEIFYQCYESLHNSWIKEANTVKAWDQVVSAIVEGKHRLKNQDKRKMSSKQKLELSNLEQLEKVPTHNVEILTIEHLADILQYLHKAFEAGAHPLGKLMEELVDVFRAAYIGIGAHPRLLYHAIQEIQSYIKRIYKVIRILFPELPASGDPSHVYPKKKQRASTPIKENMGFLQRQISEVDEGTHMEVVSASGILQPILLPRIYPALFDLYALHSDRDDDKYWERVQKLNKQGDMSLMAYLGIDQNFWCMDASVIKEKKVRISSIRDHSYSKAVDVLQQISTAFCPLDKLEVIKKTFLAITQSVQEALGEDHIWCMDDLFPIFQFVVIRARIHHLGAEIKFIEELMESYLEFGELGIMFTTLKACYFQIQNEKIPSH